MPYFVKKNRIGELIETIRTAQDKGKSEYKEQARDVSYILLAELKGRTPVGRIEPNYTISRNDRTFTISHGRPSLRQHGMTLGSGWLDPQLDVTDKGVSFKLLSAAPHMKLILAGAPRHPIPRTGSALQSFWWFKAPFLFKAAIYSRIDHPGFEGSMFVERSVERIQPIIISKFRAATMQVFETFRQYFR